MSKFVSPLTLLVFLLGSLHKRSLTSVYSYQFRTPYHVPWVAEIDEFDIAKDAKDEETMKMITQDCFEKCPILIFKNQSESLTAKEFFDFVQKFDPDVDVEAIEQEKVLHPFRREPDAPHVSLREEDLGSEFRWGLRWHMDLVGAKSTRVPNIVSAFHFMNVPPQGGNTIFANLDMAYAKIPPLLKKELDKLNCIYCNDFASLLKYKLDSDGFRCLGPFPSTEQEKDPVIQSLVRKDKTVGKKRMFFNPVRFNCFEGWTSEESWEYMTYIFHTYVNTPENSVSVKWEKGDVAIFNNHAMIHTSTPWELYNGKGRRFRLTFLNSKVMFEDDVIEGAHVKNEAPSPPPL